MPIMNTRVLIVLLRFSRQRYIADGSTNNRNIDITFTLSLAVHTLFETTSPFADPRTIGAQTEKMNNKNVQHARRDGEQER